jgi:hypothetical protein
MPSVEQIRPIKRRAESELLSKKNVQAVDIGRKLIAGEKTDELSIRVYVAKKEDVAKKDLVPPELEGIKTDVIERTIVLHPRFLPVADLRPHLDAGRYDPLRGGISIGPCRSVFIGDDDVACQGVPAAGWYIFVGTLGVMVRDRASGDEMLLSNFHVMCVDNGWAVGNPIAQPSRVDGGTCPADVIGELTRASLGGQVDGAVARRTARTAVCEIVDIGDVHGTANAAVGMAVRKRGRTTQLTHGVVDTVDLTVTIDYCDGLGSVTLTDQIGIDVDAAQSASFGLGGDSGSVVVDAERNVVGLYFAGTEDGSFGVANPIQSVLDTLQVDLCLPPKPLPKDWPKDPLKDWPKDLPKDWPKDPPKDWPKDPPKDWPKDPPKDWPKDPPKDFPKDPPKDFPKDPPKDFPKDPPKDWPKDPPKDWPKDPPKDFPKDPPKDFPKDFPKDPPKDFPKDPPKDWPKDLPKDFPKDPPKDFPKDPPKDWPKDFPKDFPKDPPKDFPKDPPKDWPKDPPKDFPKDPPKDFPKDPPKDFPKDPGLEPPKNIFAEPQKPPWDPPKSIVDPPKSFLEPPDFPGPTFPGPTAPGEVPFVLATPAGAWQARPETAALASAYERLLSHYSRHHARGLLDEQAIADWSEAAAVYQQLVGGTGATGS